MSNNHLKMLLRQGEKLSKQGKLNQAIECYEHILHHDANNIHALFALGNIGKRLQSYELAETMFRTLLSVEPSSIEAANNLGLVLVSMERVPEAIEIYKATLALNPESSETWLNAGVAVAHEGDVDMAYTFYEEALRLKPRNSSALANMAELKASKFEHQASLELLDRAIKIDKGNPQLHYHRGIDLLTLGRLSEGWAELDYRLKPNMAKSIKFEHKLHSWRGQPLAGKKILISAEQGIGDQLLFLSCIPDIIAMADEVTIEVEPRLVDLFARSFPKASVRAYDCLQEGENKVFKYDWQVNKLDFAISQLSLFRWLRNDIADFPDESILLKTDGELDKKWAKKVKAQSKGLNVGVCWRGGRGIKAREVNYAPLSDWQAVFKVAGVSFFNLMYDECADDVAEIKDSFGADVISFDGLDYKNDIDDVAALSKQMDMVISAPSTPSAIAAVVGVETLVLLKSAAWTMLGTGRFPYCPTMKPVLNDTADDWQGSMAKAAKILKERVKAN